MEGLWYFFVALAIPIVVSGLCCLIFALSATQRARPSLWLVVPSALSSLAAIVAFTALVSLLGSNAANGLTIGLLLATLSLAGPVLTKAFIVA